MSERFFATELAGMNVKTADGRLLGKLEDVVVDTASGEMRYILLNSCTENCGSFRTDHSGRKIVEFRSMQEEKGTLIVTI